MVTESTEGERLLINEEKEDVEENNNELVVELETFESDEVDGIKPKLTITPLPKKEVDR